MRVSFFLQDLDGGGAERAIIGLADEVSRVGHEVDLVVGYADTDYRSEVTQRVNLVDFGSRSPLVVFPKLVGYLRACPPQVIMSALDLANIMMIMATTLVGYEGRRVISQRSMLDTSLRDLNRVRRWLTWLLMGACFPRADAVISNSHSAAFELEEKLSIPNHKIFAIQNAINVDRISQLAQVPLNEPFTLAEHEPLVVTVGSLTKGKDMVTLIKAFSVVHASRPSRLILIGKGPERPSLEALIKSLDLEGVVYLAGFDANPYKWIRAASVFVSSSTKEGFPNVIAEALAMDCPIVATDCPGDTAELLGHGKWGRLVPVGDPAIMAEAILSTLDDPNPPRGSSRAADFSPAKNLAAYLEALLSEGRAAKAISQSMT